MRDRPMESHVGTLMNQCRGLTRDKSRESQISDEYGEGIGGGSSVVVGKLVAASRFHHTEHSSTESTSFTQVHE